jgi:hypothetical protein
MATAIPVSGAGTYDDPTWGESGGPYSVPAEVATGLGSVALASNTVNYNWQHLARWSRAIRDRMVWSDSGLYASFILPNSGTWTTGGGTLNGNCPQALVSIDADDDGGVVVQFYVSVGSPHLFTASKDTYVNLDETGAVEYQEVNLGDPAPTPTAGYVAVWLVVTDATEITTVTPLLSEVPVFKDVEVESLVVGGALNVTGLCTFSGSGLVGDDAADSWSFTATVNFNNGVTIGSSSADTCTVNSTLAINNDSTIGASSADTCTVNAVLVINNNSTIGSDGTDTCTVNATLAINNNSTIGSSSADTCTINATTTLAATLNIGANEIEGTAGSIVDVERVDVTEIRFDSDASPSTTTGVMQFASRWLTVGLNTVARKVSIPVDDWLASFSTVNAIEDTGAEVTMVLATGDIVTVEMSFEAANTSAANNVNVRIEVNGGSIGSTEPYRPVANDIFFAVRRVVEYTAPSDNVYVFKARVGASAGTTSVQNVHVSVRHSN